MPAYGTVTTVALAPGQKSNLMAVGEANITKTRAVAIGAVAGVEDNVTLVNSTNQAAPVEVAAQDADANYLPLQSGGAALSVPAGDAITFPYRGGFLRAHFAVAPNAGSLTILR